MINNSFCNVIIYYDIQSSIKQMENMMKSTMSSMTKSEQPHDILDKGVYNNMAVEIKGHSAIGLVKGADFEENKVQVLIWVDADKVMEAE